MTHERIDAAALYRAHAPYVARLLARLGTDANEMEDLVQEVFVVAHRRGGFAPGAAKATTWLAEIAFRVHANARRARARRLEPEADVDDAGSSQDAASHPERALEAVQRRARVRRCLSALDEEHRLALVLFEIEGHDCAEIAAVLGVPVGTVYSRLHAARRRFESAWRREAADDDAADGREGSDGA